MHAIKLDFFKASGIYSVLQDATWDPVDNIIFSIFLACFKVFENKSVSIKKNKNLTFSHSSKIKFLHCNGTGSRCRMLQNPSQPNDNTVKRVISYNPWQPAQMTALPQSRHKDLLLHKDDLLVQDAHKHKPNVRRSSLHYVTCLWCGSAAYGQQCHMVRCVAMGCMSICTSDTPMPTSACRSFPSDLGIYLVALLCAHVHKAWNYSDYYTQIIVTKQIKEFSPLVQRKTWKTVLKSWILLTRQNVFFIDMFCLFVERSYFDHFLPILCSACFLYLSALCPEMKNRSATA